ncbi:hypothetical protein D8Y22_19110 [Salinadaptatus halalkaliphilus]|uniref:HVO-0234-like beta-propeller domain-containing protein n=1 Tax=Salinadaptatus halalkaliphilus TaxID=2419781 RepID=A0A4S3TH09_9EURY|nr:hypothetical protein [Salinadaptatus halalkaliphilus]THE63274.1 hypothetical protein D8Y22_19110 [Salinadaptatus halalkaliphilus]
MATIEEKRVYGDREGAIDAYVASAMGVVRVRVAGATVGEFSLQHRCSARDITVTDVGIAVATDENLCILETDAATDTDRNGDDPPVVDTEFGPAVAVGSTGPDLVAADADGRVARRRDDGSWESLVPEPIDAIKAIDGDLVGTDSGVYRIHGDTLDHAGLTDVRDVAAAAGVPLAATVDGLYKLGNGWLPIREGNVDVVTADLQADPGRLTRAHAVSGETIYEYAGDDEWERLETPPVDGSIVDVGYGETVYAVTDDGTFCAATLEDGVRGWRTRALGITDVRGLAIEPSRAPAAE